MILPFQQLKEVEAEKEESLPTEPKEVAKLTLYRVL